MEDRGGRLELLLPYATLEPVRELLLQQFMGEKFGRDLIWETHLAEELWNTEVELEVVLDEQVMRLADVMSLAPGARILLKPAPARQCNFAAAPSPCLKAVSAAARAASPCGLNAISFARNGDDGATIGPEARKLPRFDPPPTHKRPP